MIFNNLLKVFSRKEDEILKWLYLSSHSYKRPYRKIYFSNKYNYRHAPWIEEDGLNIMDGRGYNSDGICSTYAQNYIINGLIVCQFKFYDNHVFSEDVCIRCYKAGYQCIRIIIDQNKYHSSLCKI